MCLSASVHIAGVALSIKEKGTPSTVVAIALVPVATSLANHDENERLCELVSDGKDAEDTLCPPPLLSPPVRNLLRGNKIRTVGSLQCAVTSPLLHRGPITSLFICQKVGGGREVDEEVWEPGEAGGETEPRHQLKDEGSIQTDGAEEPALML